MTNLLSEKFFKKRHEAEAHAKGLRSRGIYCRVTTQCKKGVPVRSVVRVYKNNLKKIK